MKRPDLLQKKFEKAKRIAYRCVLAGVQPAQWVRKMLEGKK